MEILHPPSPSPPPNSISISILQSSIQNLIANWQRRQKWNYYLSCFHQPGEEDVDPKRAPWRDHLANFLESTPGHLVALFLLLADLVLTVLDLSSSLVSCSSEDEIEEEDDAVYHWGGIAILAVVLERSLGLAVALGRSYFKRPGRVVDGAVVIGALLLEVLAEVKGAGLLVVVSLWRVLRVVETAFELSDEAIEAEMEAILCQIQLLRDENLRLQETINKRDERIAELEAALVQEVNANIRMP